MSIYVYNLEDTKVGKAILHNQSLCRRAQAGNYKDFRTAPCGLAGATKPAIGLPREVLPAGAEVGCLVLRGGGSVDEFKKALDDDHDDSSDLCPQVAVQTRPPGTSAVTESTLVAQAGILTETSDCCNIDRLWFAMKG